MSVAFVSCIIHSLMWASGYPGRGVTWGEAAHYSVGQLLWRDSTLPATGKMNASDLEGYLGSPPGQPLQFCWYPWESACICIKKLTGIKTAGSFFWQMLVQDVTPFFFKKIHYILYLTMNSPYHPVVSVTGLLICFSFQVLDNSKGCFYIVVCFWIFCV